MQLYLKLTIHISAFQVNAKWKKGAKTTYKPLEVLGPEHEYSLVGGDLQVLPISDKIIKAACGKIINFIEMPKFTFGKELQLHVMEIKANQPFKSPIAFEETMQTAVTTLNQIIHKHGANLLGTGMHPLLKLRDTAVWPHYHKKIYIPALILLFCCKKSTLMC